MAGGSLAEGQVTHQHSAYHPPLASAVKLTAGAVFKIEGVEVGEQRHRAFQMAFPFLSRSADGGWLTVDERRVRDMRVTPSCGVVWGGASGLRARAAERRLRGPRGRGPHRGDAVGVTCQLSVLHLLASDG